MTLVKNRYLTGVVMAFILAATVVQLRNQGRVWACVCGRWTPWMGDIWSAHNSQHVFDPYSFTHILHGVLLFWVISWRLKKWPFAWQLTLAVLLESLWEVVENSPFIIQRYREATIGLGYEGDSIINSLADVLCCSGGFVLARIIGFRFALAIFVAVEVLLAVLVRDNLTLNVLMLLCPIEAVKQWQMVH